MPYLGLAPTTGENNNFRILDDITSYTLTFDGSSASVVSTSDDTISEVEHRFITGQRVTYNNGGGSNIGGLTSGTVYYIYKSDKNSFGLSTSASNAASGSLITLSSVGGGSSHTLNVAFDGTNTKFKATYNNGTHAEFTRAAQLQLSINGVIQQPFDSTSPSNGFGWEINSVIVFSTAPASTDAFWGHLYANNNPTYDIADNKVDTFVGTGSTTDFTLSKNAVTNENLLVTIDGVVQYPTVGVTTRAYTTSDNVIQFTSAPGSGVDIQVRHIGFAGATSGTGSGVAAFYGRTGNVTLTSSDNPVIGNLTAVDATFSGNVSIAKTLTYEDVTSIDSVGIVTARSGIVDSTLTATRLVYVDSDKSLTDDSKLFYDGTSLNVGAANSSFGAAGGFFRGSNTAYDTGDTSPTLYVRNKNTTAATNFASVRIDTSGNGLGVVSLNALSNSTSASADFSIQTRHSGTVAERLRILSTGLVGIGVTNPTKLLELKGTDPTIKLWDSSGDAYALLEGDSADQGSLRFRADPLGAGANTHIRFDVDGTEALRIGSTGVSTFTNAVRVVKSSGALLELTTNTGAADATLRLSEGATGTTTNGGGMFYSGADNKLYVTCGTDSTTKRITVDRDTGNVGINSVIGAGSKFEINSGTSYDVTTFNSYHADGPLINVQKSGTNIGFVGSGKNLHSTTGVSTALAIRSQDVLTFATSGANERLRITSGGQIGVNKTSPKEWHTSYKSIQLYDAGYIAGSTDDSFVALGANNYLDTGGSYDYTNSDFASQLYQVNGELVFRNAASGTANAAISWAEKLKIDATGHTTINATTYDGLTINTTENGTNGPQIQLTHISASPAANDVIGQLRFSGKDSDGNTDLMSKIETIIDSPTSGAETAHLDFATRGLGAWNPIFRLCARSSASAPSYTTDNINGIILDTYNTGNPYPRYMSLIAKSAGDTDSNLSFWTESVGGSPTEKVRITANGRLNVGTGELDQTDRMLNVYGGRIRISGLPNNSNSLEIYASATTGQSYGIMCQAGTNASDINSTFRNTSGATLFRVRGDGNIGITTATPQRKLHLFDYAESNIRIQGGYDYYELRAKDSDNHFSIHQNRNNAGSKELVRIYEAHNNNGGIAITGDSTATAGPILYLKDTASTGTPSASIMSTDKGSLYISADDGSDVDGSYIQFKQDNTNTWMMNEYELKSSSSGMTAKHATLLGSYHSENYNSHDGTCDLTAFTANRWTILEVFGSVNPNTAGSGAYTDPIHMYIYKGTGWNGSNATHYIYSRHIAPPARDVFPSGTGANGNNVSVVWYNGSSESTECGNGSSSHYVRFKLHGFNATYGPNFQIRALRRF